MARNALAAPIQTKSERDYQAEDDHRTLSRAAEIQSDRTRMAGAARHHRKETKKMTRMGRMFGNRGTAR